ncbi:alkaline phosphatase D family protein [Actinomadura xylanilytica]|uniref:alkaline phosphatase D family protein n=1 Tax=Actinomadura xylanilytica TaxID=887459 RepID=UPI00255A9F97|nr:alkaline phosphatase D family protein [Actinomadura xylanilytica]MDL4774403.1 alkaline phosphatase D family protein [Actinomadura xylanilytica]
MTSAQNRPSGPSLGRRELLAGGGALGLGAAAAGFSTSKAWAAPAFGDDPFTLGVASGDPWPDGVVLWTRLAPQPLALDGLGGMPPHKVEVVWEVAADERFRKIVRRGRTHAVPELAHSVHVEVSGLAPGREYFYRFRAGGAQSPAGRTRTAPAHGAALSELKFGVASCQAWFEGHYTAYRHLAEEDVDFIFHLGDYIYENPIDEAGGVRNVALPAEVRAEPYDLTQYRLRHALHHYDPDIIAAHQAHPWALIWDDHEIDDNWVGDFGKDPGTDPAVFRKRKAAAFQAYYENLPLRLPNKPNGPSARLYRGLGYGRLAQFHLLDTRQYRDDQACGDKTSDCAERLTPGRTVLGDAQERWLFDGLRRSRATWNIIPQQIPVTQVDTVPGDGRAFVMDFWDGYKPARDRLFARLADPRVRNPVVLTGDMHRHMAADLRTDFDDPRSRTIGVEFVGTSISTKMDGMDLDPGGQDLLDANEHIKFTSYQRGYVRCTLTKDTCRADFRVLPYVTRPGAPVSTRASFVTENGNPGLQAV